MITNMSKRRLVVEDSSSSEEEEREEVRRPVVRPQRSSVKTYSSFKSSSSALEDVLQEEDVSLWKEEEEDERDRRVHFVVDDDGAGYADDDVDYKGKEYATMLSDDDDDDEGNDNKAAAAGSGPASKAWQKKKPQQDLFSMFTKVERKQKTAAASATAGAAEEDEAESAPAGAAVQPAGEGEEEDTDALLALLSSKPSASAHKRKPVVAKAPARILAVARKPLVAAPAALPAHEDYDHDDDNNHEMVLGDEPRPVSPPVPEEAPKLSTRSRLLAAAANRPAPAPAQVAPAPIAQEALELPEAAVPTGTFLPTTATAVLPLPASTSNLVFPLLPSDTHKEAIEFYWTDIYETRPGELYLFGRVDVQDEAGGTGSCCVCLKHVSRSLVVLPTHPCDTDESKRLVVEEVLNAVRQHRLERSALEGMRFKTKWVTKSYAFELPDIPRGESQYLLVEYSMYSERAGGGAEDFPSSGTHYSHVFGANQSTIERFLLAHKIMGPCWLRLDTNEGISREKTGASHCKYEAELALSKLTVTANKPAPPVSVLSLALKTVVDPSTHQHQIVVATGVFHSRIPLDGASEVLDENAGQVRFQLVRPVVLDGNGGGGRLDAFRNLKFTHPNVQFQPNERALLSCLMGLLHNLDADFLCGHNIEGFELDLLLSRLKAHNIKQWSKLGRLNLSRFPNSTRANGRQSHFGVLTPGRLIVDTYTSAQEFLLGQREYSLTALCESVGLLKTRRQDLDPSQVPAMFQSPQALVHLLNHNVETCMLQLKLAFKLEVFTLSLELTAIAGNLWRRTLGSGRAERIEYLLSHAFFNQDFIIPDKEPAGGARKKKAGKRSNGPSYAGGLVLEPKPGLYDSYVVLLDFNALYPSIIQEYNICFTTVQRPAVEEEGDSRKRAKAHGDADADADADGEEEADGAVEAEDEPPVLASNQPPEEVPLPADNGRGPNGLAILPRVIQNIVDRRKQVQAQLKDESDVLKRRQLDTRQKALKITANSMYGCLGFASSRYFARPLASLITSQGRMILMDTVDTTERLGLKVLYGDTDSIMIDTQLANTGRQEVVSQVTKIADEIIKAVNPKYKYLKIALDGIFKTLLLLKKKKYASLKLVLSKLPAQIEVKRETKGLDLVRRDWCPASQRLGSDVLDLVLTGQQREEICDGIRAVLIDFKDKLATLPLAEFTITKGLNKHPKDYPDNGRSNPHVQVAKRMLEKSKVVNVGDHIPFVICKTTGEGGGGSMAQRAFHPDEVVEQNLEVDLDWYVSTQMFPPVQRLVEVMDGITPSEVAAALGMDASKFQQLVQHNSFQSDSHAAHFDSIFGHTFQADLDRFALCDKIALVCPQCQHAFDFAGVGRLPGATDAESAVLSPGASCPQCGNNEVVDAIVLQNLLTLSARKAIGTFYHNQLVPKDAMVEAEFKTRQLGLRDYVPYNKRRIALKREVSPKQLWIQLYYLVCLVDCKRFDELLGRENDLRTKKGQSTLSLRMTANTRQELGLVKDYLERTFLHNSAFGWVEPELFQKAFRLSAEAGAAAEE